MDEQERDIAPLVTDEIRATVGIPCGPFPLRIERERLPLILAEAGLDPATAIGPVLEPWLVAGLSASQGAPLEVPELLPVSALIQLEWQFFAPFPGDRPLDVVSRLADIRDRVGGRYGHTVVITTEAEILDGGRPVASHQVTRIQFRPVAGGGAAGRPGSAGAPNAPGVPTPFPLPGERRFAQVQIGDDIGPVVRIATERTIDAFLPVVVRARESQSGSEEAALASGYEGLVVPLGAHMAWLALLVSRWAGRRGTLQHLRAAFREPDYLHRPLELMGRVVDVRRDNEGGHADIDCAVFGSGRQSVRASAGVLFELE